MASMELLVLGNINSPTLEEGINYHVIPGKQKNSKLYVKGDFAYKLDKQVGNIRYLVCKFPSCSVRCSIKNSFLTTNSEVDHTCRHEGASAAMWTALACQGRMKLRAEREGTSFQVCPIYVSKKLNVN